MSKLIEGCGRCDPQYCPEEWKCSLCNKAREHQKTLYFPSILLKWKTNQISSIELLNSIPDSVWNANDSIKGFRLILHNAIDQVDWSNIKGVP